MGVGIETICSNAIGSRTFSTIDKNIWAAVKLLVIFGGVSFCTMIVAPDGLIRALLPKNSPADVLSLTRNILPWVWVVFLTEGTWFSIQSVLTAAGDTRFTMWVNVVVFWLVVVCPVCVGLAMRWCGAKFYWQMIVVEQCLCVFLMYRRYRSEVWKRHKI
jgi:Na+-driven multidrug efflux pump